MTHSPECNIFPCEAAAFLCTMHNATNSLLLYQFFPTTSWGKFVSNAASSAQPDIPDSAAPWALMINSKCFRSNWWIFLCLEMPGEATETVPATEQEMQQPQAETGLYFSTAWHGSSFLGIVNASSFLGHPFGFPLSSDQGLISCQFLSQTLLA